VTFEAYTIKNAVFVNYKTRICVPQLSYAPPEGNCLGIFIEQMG
jgi:hypothetical protein